MGLIPRCRPGWHYAIAHMTTGPKQIGGGFDQGPRRPVRRLHHRHRISKRRKKDASQAGHPRQSRHMHPRSQEHARRVRLDEGDQVTVDVGDHQLGCPLTPMVKGSLRHVAQHTPLALTFSVHHNRHATVQSPSSGQAGHELPRRADRLECDLRFTTACNYLLPHFFGHLTHSVALAAPKRHVGHFPLRPKFPSGPSTYWLQVNFETASCRAGSSCF